MTAQELAAAWEDYASDPDDMDYRNKLWVHYRGMANTAIDSSIKRGRVRRNDRDDLRSHLYCAIPTLINNCKPANAEAFGRYGWTCFRRMIGRWAKIEARKRGVSLDTGALDGERTMMVDTLVAPSVSLSSLRNFNLVAEGLEPMECVALFLRYYTGRNKAMCARLMQVSPAHVATLLESAHDQLRDDRCRGYLFEAPQ